MFVINKDNEAIREYILRILVLSQVPAGLNLSYCRGDCEFFLTGLKYFYQFGGVPGFPGTGDNGRLFLELKSILSALKLVIPGTL